MKKNSPVNIPVPHVIPCLDYGSEGASLHFAHANGYPPGAYRPLLNDLAVFYHVVAMYQRPLWRQSRPEDLTDWRPLATDLETFLRQENLSSVIGAGHSLGATTTLRLAIQNPKQFSALVLLDPVIFLPWMTYVWRAIMKLGLGMKIHPLAANTLRRRRNFNTPKAMFEQYRSKPVFERISDKGLHAYVDSIARPAPGGSIELAYSPEWETRIYLTGSLADTDIWRGLKKLSLPTIIIRGQETDTFQEKTANRIKKLAPHVKILSVSETGHLLPLEKPQAVARIILDFLGTLPG